jgi:eukaryotic-like serine/threonine-protein kinase
MRAVSAPDEDEPAPPEAVTFTALPDGTTNEAAAGAVPPVAGTQTYDGARTEAADPTLAVGSRFDRYIVTGLLGAGGMGVVYAAHDPELDRRVAIKVLPDLGAPRRTQQSEARLRREAQALARLSHPNVVGVYDVGTARGRLFIAMQLVDGESLDRVLAARRHSPREILALFIAAGRGLAAAHDAGIVHRDFKPSNVFVDRSGLVSVGDFGLARGAGGSSDGADDGAAPTAEPGSLLGAALTHADAIVGTPACMAPEQHLRRPVTAQSDQFSFCLALYEALYGRHPFIDGAFSRPAVIAAMQADAVRPPPPRSRVPRRIWRALRRGLRADPGERFPSMEALLATLAPRSRRGLVVAGAVAAAVAAVSILLLARGPEPGAFCERAGDALSGERDRGRAQAIAAAFAATGRPEAARSADRVNEVLDEYGRRWRSMRIDACRATHVHHVQTAAILDRRMQCLDEYLAALSGAVTTFTSHVDGEVVDRAGNILGDLPGLERCADGEAMRRARPAQSPAVHAATQQLQKILRIASSRQGGGQIRESLAMIAPLVAVAERLGDEALLGEMLAFRALAQWQLHARDAAVRDAERGLELLLASGRDDDIAIVTFVLFKDAAQRGDTAAFDRSVALARGAARRTGRLHDQIQFETSLAYALVLFDRVDDAAAACKRATALAAGEDVPLAEIADAVRCQGAVDVASGKYGSAIPSLVSGLEATTRAYGAAHSYTAQAMIELAAAYDMTGELDRGLALYEQARDIRARIYGADSVEVAGVQTKMAQLLTRSGKPGEATPLIEHAVAVLDERTPGSAEAGAAHIMLARARNHAGAPLPTWDAEYALGVAIFERVFPADHPNTLSVRATWGDALIHAGEPERGGALLEEAVAGLEKKADPRRGILLSMLAGVRVEQHRPAEALPLYERALATLTANGDGFNLPITQSNLARLLWDRGDRARARRLAQQAIDGFRALGEGKRASIEQLEAWLRSHP